MKYNKIQLMTFNEVDTRIYQCKKIIFTKGDGRGKYIILGLINPGNSIELKVIVLLYDTYLYVAFTLKISFSLV